MTRHRDHNWHDSFTSSQDNLLEGFYRPSLQESIRYWRISRAPPMAAPRGGRVKIVEADCHTPSAHAASGGSGSVSCSAPSRSPQ